MQTKHKKITWKILLAMFSAVLVILAFILFIQDNSKRAAQISLQSLKDATVQSAYRIDEILNRSMNELNLAANLYEELLKSSEVTAESLQMLTDLTSFNYIEFTNSSGIDLTPHGETADVSQRDYFIDGMNGNNGVCIVFDSKITNENLVVFYTPLHCNNEIIGVLTGSYNEKYMADILYNTFFGEDSKSFLCLQDGTIIASLSENYASKSIFESKNFSKGLSQSAEDGLRNALLNGENYEFQYNGSYGTGNAYAAFLGNSKWVLVQTFPSQVTSRFIQSANNAGIILLIELAAIFITYIIIILITNWIRNKNLIQENTDMSYVIDGIIQIYKVFVLVDLNSNTYKYIAGTKPRYEHLAKSGCYDNFKDRIVESVIDKDEKASIEKLLGKEALQKNMNKDNPHLRYEFHTNREKGKWDGINLICLKRQNGIPTEILFTYQDVTKMKEREQRGFDALKEAYQAVESANQAKSSFLSNMSHDIRTPMNAIMGMTAIASMNINDPDRVKDCLNKITVSSQHLLGLINEVLDMSKIESGKLVFSYEEFNLSDVVENMVTMFLPQTKAKNQHFNVNIAEIEHEEVIGDSMRLQQIIVNIIGNSVKFTQDGGNISFGISEKPSGMHGYGCYVFTFEDNGIGMEESFIDKIFEPFVRAKNSSENKIEGTGLGMPIVKNLVQMMNGNIKVESKLNEGTKFTVTVYLQLNHSKHDDLKGLENLTVLVADDDKFACESACSALTEIGMISDWVLSGEEAIEKILDAHSKSNDYSAVILDWKMPGMDGVETARAIRQKIGSEVPIIILSAFDYSVVEQEARAAGVNAFISKPLFRSRLVYVMKSLTIGSEEEYTEIEDLQSRNYSGKRVLLVEDNDINMEIAEELLSQTGVSVDKAANGRIAVDRINEMPEGYYDLVFMDIQMPQMNGYEAASAIRASARKDLKTLPIIAMSADVFMDDIKRTQDAGMNGHVSKPVEIKNLLKALDEWI